MIVDCQQHKSKVQYYVLHDSLEKILSPMYILVLFI